jgi:hypothetical protein
MSVASGFAQAGPALRGNELASVKAALYASELWFGALTPLVWRSFGVTRTSKRVHALRPSAVEARLHEARERLGVEKRCRPLEWSAAAH